ncbi:MAG TPA: hypothetical protein VMV45_10625 [Casimicrobiaceae bacterium]|nr:hypothetical protein [Casimicrobiaceae bacterium]
MYTLGELYWWRILFVALLIGVVALGIVLRVVFVGLRKYAKSKSASRGAAPAVTCDCERPARRTASAAQTEAVDTRRVFADGSRAIYIH